MSDPVLAAAIKARRKALGWARRELAERAGLDPSVVQLVELDQWDEAEALARLQTVLDMAEGGHSDPRIKPPERGEVAVDAAPPPGTPDNGG